MGEDKTYRAFLSYSHVNRGWARWLHRALESYRPPRHLFVDADKGLAKRLSPIFRDRDELPSAASLTDAVESALRRSDWLIVVCSPQAAASRWVNEEIRIFRQLGRSDRILCLVVDGEPNAGDDTECFPPVLLEPIEPGGDSLEPIAADARPGGDGKRNALLKIAAGMLGVGFDALRQRDLNRRYRQLAGVAAGSILIAAVTVTLAITATIARDAAERRREQAEDLVDFMLGDLQVRLHEIGRLDVYESVGDKALEYFASLREEDASSRSLYQRGRNLQQIGEMRMDSGNFDAALEAFKESNLIYERLAELDPLNAEWQVALGTSYFWVGYIHWQLGDLRLAKSEIQKVTPIIDAVSLADPDNADWLTERGYAHTNLARILELEGAYEDALATYQTVMEINQRLLSLEPGNPDWQNEVGFAHNNIGKVSESLGRLSEAEAHYRADLAIKEKIFAADRQHNFKRSEVAASEYFLGAALLRSGDYDESMELLWRASDAFQILTQLAPDRTDWLARQSNIWRELANLSMRTGNLVDAEKLAGTAIEGFQSLLALDDANVRWRRDLVRSQISAAAIDIQNSRPEAAVSRLTSASDHMDYLMEREPTNRETVALALEVDVKMAVLHFESDPESSNALLRNTMQAIERDFDGSNDPQILELQSTALRALGEGEKAVEIDQRIAAMGYRTVSTQ